MDILEKQMKRLNPEKLRKLTLNEEVDYLFLTSALKHYKNPRAKITALLRSNVGWVWKTQPTQSA